MATPVFMEGGGDASYGLDFFTNLSGSVSVETTITNGFPRSILVDSGTSTANVKVTGIMDDAGRRVSYRFRFNALPGGNSTKIIAAETTTTGTYPVSLILRSDGTLALSCAGQTLTGTTALAVDTWYRISFAYIINADTSAEVRVFLDGALELTLSAASGATTGTNAIRIGWFTSSPGTNVLGYLRDIYIDDGTTLDDIGDVYVTAKLPAALGAANSFDTPVGGPFAQRWDYVNERAFNTANRLTHAATSDVAENFGIQAAAAGDKDITGATVLGMTGYVYAAKGSGGGTPAADLTVNGTDYPISSTALTTSYKVFTHSDALSSYPAVAAVVGMRSTAATPDTLLAEAGVMVAYIPSTGPTIVTGSAALSGSSTLAATGHPEQTGSAALTSTGTLTAAALLELRGTLPLTGAGTLAAGGQMELTGTLTLLGTGTLAAGGASGATGTLALLGTGTLTATGTLELHGSLALVGDGTLTANNVVGAPFGVLAVTLTFPGHLLIATANAGLLLIATTDPGFLALSSQPPGVLTLTHTPSGSLSLE